MENLQGLSQYPFSQDTGKGLHIRRRDEIDQVSGTATIGCTKARCGDRGTGEAREYLSPSTLPSLRSGCIPDLDGLGLDSQIINVPMQRFERA